jgi:hypothetical protein
VPFVLLVPLLLVGPVWLLTAGARRRWDALPRPGWAMGPGVAAVGGMVVAGAETVAVLAATDAGAGLALALWTAHAVLAPMWWWMLLARERFPAAFTVLCADWTALAMATAAFAVFTPGTAPLAAASLAWLTWMGASVFGLWQAGGARR